MYTRLTIDHRTNPDDPFIAELLAAREEHFRRGHPTTGHIMFKYLGLEWHETLWGLEISFGYLLWETPLRLLHHTSQAVIEDTDDSLILQEGLYDYADDAAYQARAQVQRSSLVGPGGPTGRFRTYIRVESKSLMGAQSLYTPLRQGQLAPTTLLAEGPPAG